MKIAVSVLCIWVSLICIVAHGQTLTLPYRPVSAEYSTALDRIVMISASPDQLHIYDPASNSETTVNLPKPPLSLSVSLDGMHAAVGHDALISYVNLGTSVLEKMLTVPTTVSSLVLGNDWVYILSYSNGVTPVQISTGVVNSAYGVYEGSKGRLHPSGTALYTTQDGLSPEHLIDLNVSSGPPTSEDDGPYHGDYAVCGGVWFSPDGHRAYTGCATAYQAAPQNVGGFLQLGGNLDGMYWGSLAGVAQIRSLSESAALGRVAAIPIANTYNGPTVKDNQVLLYDSAFLEPAGALQLPDFTAGSNTYQAHGQQVFFNKASTALYVVMQADGTSGLLNDFAVRIIPIGNPPVCAPSFGATPAAVDAAGTVTTATITAGADCIYQAASNVNWIQLIAGAYGSGNGTLTYVVRPNTGASRTGTITIGGQTLTVTQLAPPATPPSLTPLGVSVASAVYGAAYSKTLDKLVYITAAPKELHIYDPVSGADTIVALPKVPLCLSVGPDGLSAAVGYDGWISLVDLSTAKISSNLQALTDVHSILLGGKGYVYAFPLSTWGHLFSFATATGAMSVQTAIYDGRDPQLYVDGNTFYTEGSKWDISQGAAKPVSNSSSGGGCAPIWLTEDGTRMFTGCASAYTTSPVPSLDLQYNGSLSNAAAVQWAAESAKMHSTAIIPAIGYSQTNSTDDTALQMYGDQYLGFAGSLALPAFMVGSTQYTGHGRYVFWNNAVDKLIVLEQADAQSKLTADYGVAVFPLAAPAAGCTITLGGTTAAFDNNGGLNNISISTGANCVWEAVSNAPWITVNAGAVGFGSNTVNYAVAPNANTSGRTGTVTIAGHTFTVTQSGATQVTGAITSPVNGTTLVSSAVTFQWSSGTASQFGLWIGSTGVGSADLAAPAAGVATSYAATGLPTDGRPIYVRLWSQVNGMWQYNDYTYTAVTISVAAMTSPANGSTLMSSTVTFQWTAGTATQIGLWIGSTGVGSADLAAPPLTTSTSYNATGLPTDGRTIYVRLWSHFNDGSWKYTDSSYATVNLTPGVIMNPANSSTLPSSSVRFQWSAGGASQFGLWIGSTGVGSADLAAPPVTTSTSYNAAGLPTDGRTIYVRLWSQFSNGGWKFTDSSYATMNLTSGAISSPMNGSTLPSSSVTFQWSPGGASQFGLWIGSTGVGSADLAAPPVTTSTSYNAVGLPTDGRTIYVRLWSQFNDGSWRYSDSQYTAVNFNPGVITVPMNGSTLPSSSATFQWSPGGASQFGLWIGSTGVGSADLGTPPATTLTSYTATGLPTDGRTVYVRLWSQFGNGSWRYNDYTYKASTQ